jgi:transposase-like protein
MKTKVLKVEQKKRFYDTSFKEQAVALAEEIGIKMAQEKLGITGKQVLRNWVNKKNKQHLNNSESDDLREEIKKLKKELEKEKKITAILKDATIFFCQDQQK